MGISNTTFESLRSSGRLSILSDDGLVIALQELSVLLNEAESEENLGLNLLERFGDPILYENIDMGAVFQKRSLQDKRVYVPWVKETSGSIGNPDILKTQKFRNAVLFRSSMASERTLTLERVKTKYMEIQALIEKRQKELGDN